jgi:tripartite-type tricarboxylate transporter receptor subunit TctC
MKFARILAAIALSAVALTPFTPAFAQYPNKPIKVIVPFPAGSATDTITRILGNSVSQSIGQTVVVENKAGADGAIAGAEVAKAPADGYTLLMATNSPMAVAPAMKKNPPYDPVNDFTPITDIGRYTFFLFAYAGMPQKTLGEIISYAKANPGKVTYATGNTTGIVSFAQMNSLAGIQMLHIPYKGEPAAVTDLIAGRVQLIFATPTTGLAHVKDGKLRAIVTSLKQRSPILPDVPTIGEAGLPKFSILSWAALYGPAKMPKDVTDRLNREFHAAMKRPDVVAAMEKQAFILTPSTPAELGAFTKEQMEEYRAILRAAGVQPE